MGWPRGWEGNLSQERTFYELDFLFERVSSRYGSDPPDAGQMLRPPSIATRLSVFQLPGQTWCRRAKDGSVRGLNCMSVIFLLIPLSIIIAICFLGAFIWAVRSGQYEDTCTPSMRLLLEEKRGVSKPKAKGEEQPRSKE